MAIVTDRRSPLQPVPAQIAGFPPAWCHSIRPVDLPQIYYTAIAGPLRETCTWCPPGDLDRPASVLVTWRVATGRTVSRPLGDCCSLEIVHFLVGESPTVTIGVPTAYPSGPPGRAEVATAGHGEITRPRLPR